MWSTASPRHSASEPQESEVFRLERNLVVHVAALAARPRHRGLARRGRALRAEAVVGIGGAAATAATRIQHGERRVEVLQHDFGRVFLDAVLVVVFAGLQLALEVNLRALLQILLDDLAEP